MSQDGEKQEDNGTKMEIDDNVQLDEAEQALMDEPMETDDEKIEGTDNHTNDNDYGEGESEASTKKRPKTLKGLV